MKKIIKFPSMKAENREYSEETFELQFGGRVKRI